MAEVAEDSEGEASEIEIFGYVIFALFDGFVDISYSLVEIVSVKIKNSAIVVEGGDVVIGELGEV